NARPHIVPSSSHRLRWKSCSILVFLNSSNFDDPVSFLIKGRGMLWTDRIGRRLKLRDLHILMGVVECGSMSKAARRLAVSPPVISKAIADMERMLGVRLLDRGAHGVEPTLYGRSLLDTGLATFDELKQGVRKIETLANPTAGEIHIGCSELFA